MTLGENISILSLSHVRFANTRISKATVQKIISEILPSSSGIGFTRDARDLLIECCVEFITLISSEVNEISEKESKKTIACEHITKALERLGFGDYVQDIVNVASEHKEQLKGMMTCLYQKVRTKSHSLALEILRLRSENLKGSN